MKKSGSSTRAEIEKQSGSLFREWLIEKVSHSRFSLYLDDTDEEIAKRIGVQLDVLELARAKHRERLEKERLPAGQKLGHRTLFGTMRRNYIFLEPPRVVFDEFEERAERQMLTPSSLFRSILHLVLQSPTQPSWLAERKHCSWIYKGEWLGAENIRRTRYRIVTSISEGAQRALRLRAERTHVSFRAICRWGVCLYVNNKLEQLKIVPSEHAMYKKPEQYCLNPRITD